MKQDLLENAFSQLGLDDFDLRLYQCIESSLDTNITDLALKLGTNRLRIYSSLKKLKEQSLVLSYSAGNIKLASKYRLYSILETKKTELEILAKGLLKMATTSVETEKQFTTEIFKGKSGFQEVMSYILKQDITDKYFLGEVERFWDIVGWDYHVLWSEKRAKKGIQSKTLVYKNYYFENLNKKHLEQKRNVKHLPEKYKSLGSFVVFGSEIVFFDALKIIAYKIDNPIIADLLTNLFQMIWEVVSE